MHHPERKLLTKMRREPSSPVMVPQSRLTRKCFQEVLQAMQETWGRTYSALHQRLPQVQERQNGKSQFPRRQEGRQETQSRKAFICSIEQEIGQVGEDPQEGFPQV
jgi:hypothetical protein